MLLLIKVEILATYTLCLTLLDNLHNVVEQSQYSNVELSAGFRSGDRLITKVSLKVTHKEARMTCRSLRRELYIPEKYDDLGQIFSKFEIDEIHLPYEKSQLTGELIDQRTFGLVLETKKETITLKVDMNTFGRNNHVTLKKEGETYSYNMITTEGAAWALCSENLSYPHRSQDDISLPLLKNALKNKIKNYKERLERRNREMVTEMSYSPKTPEDPASILNYDATIELQELLDEKIEKIRAGTTALSGKFSQIKLEQDILVPILEVETILQEISEVLHMVTTPLYFPERLIPETLLDKVLPSKFKTINVIEKRPILRWVSDHTILFNFQEKSKTASIINNVIPVADSFYDLSLFDIVIAIIISFTTFLISMQKCIKAIIRKTKRRNSTPQRENIPLTSFPIRNMGSENSQIPRMNRPITCPPPQFNTYLYHELPKSYTLPTNARPLRDTVRRVPEPRFEIPLWRMKSTSSMM